MLKARDIAYEIESFLSTDQGEAKIKEYARQCVEEALRTAADNAVAEIEGQGHTVYPKVDRESILSTKYTTP